LVSALLQEGAAVYIYDPRVAAEDVMNAFGFHRNVHVAGMNLPLLCAVHRFYSYADVRCTADAIRHSDCVIVCTDWDEFRCIDWKAMASEMQVVSRKPSL
jgi:UDP-glucose 6-dehydrogenase